MPLPSSSSSFKCTFLQILQRLQNHAIYVSMLFSDILFFGRWEMGKAFHSFLFLWWLIAKGFAHVLLRWGGGEGREKRESERERKKCISVYWWNFFSSVHLHIFVHGGGWCNSINPQWKMFKWLEEHLQLYLTTFNTLL